MALSSIAILATALLIQAHGPAERTPERGMAKTDAELATISDDMSILTIDLFRLLGTCEAKLPPSLVGAVTSALSPETLEGATDDQRARAAPFASAYSDGRASPRAATITQEQCNAELEALSAEMTAKAERARQ